MKNRQMRRPTLPNTRPKPAAPPGAPTVYEAQLDPSAQPQLQLAAAKHEAAVHAATARRAELDNLLLQTRHHYEEGGKYVVLEIDWNAGKVRRVLAADMPKAPAKPARVPTPAPVEVSEAPAAEG
jgi:hypothetical protein